MDKNQINKRLEEILKEYKEIKPKADKLGREFELKKAEFFFDERVRGLGNQELRNAEAIKMLEQAGLLIPFEELRSQLSMLYFEKEVLIEMAKNLRGHNEE